MPSFRSNALAGFHWKPDRHTAFALLTYALVVATFFVAFQVITTERVAANFIVFGPIGLVGLGIAVPVFWTVGVRRQSLAEIGLTTRFLVLSLILSAILGWDTYSNTIARTEIAWTRDHIALATMAIAVGLFEAVFFRGWLQLRFEEAFGLVPGVLLGALCYAFYHVGYGMTVPEMMFLFGYGIVWGAIFRLTRSIFALWPLYTPVGSLYSNLSDGLFVPFEATYGFVLVIVLALAVIAIGYYWRGRQRGHETTASIGSQHDLIDAARN